MYRATAAIQEPDFHLAEVVLAEYPPIQLHPPLASVRGTRF